MALTKPRYRQIDTGVVSTADPITVLNQGASAANVDVGFLFNRANGLVPNVALYWSESTQSIVTTYTDDDGSTNSNISVSSYANLTVGNVLMVNGSILNVTGNIYANVVGTFYGSVTTAEDISTSGNVYTNGILWASNGNPMTTPVAGVTGQIQYNSDTELSAAELYYYSSNSAVVIPTGVSSTSTTTGALQITGGLGVSENVYVGAVLDVAGVDIISNVAGLSAAIVTANTSLKNYVDGRFTNLINGAPAALDTLYEIATSLGNNTELSTTLLNAIAGANAAIITANTELKSYTDDQITNANTVLSNYTDYKVTTANTAVNDYIDYNVGQLSNQITNANTALKNYVDYNDTQLGNQITTANTALKNYTDLEILTANTALKNYTDYQITTANNAVVMYSTDIVIAANTAMKAYVDAGVTSLTANAATQQGQITTLQSQVYTNSNVDAHLSSTGAGNITISSGAFSLTATGPGATTVGGTTTIPVITTDAYGRVSALTSASISTTLNTVGTTGTGAVSLASQSLMFSSTNGMIVAASGATVAISTPQNLQTTASPTFAGLTTNGNTVINGTSYLSGVARFTNSTVSSGVGNGALIVVGGVGVGDTSYFGGDLYVTGNVYTPNLIATSTSTLNTSSPMVYFAADPYPYNFETGFYSHFVGGPANVYAHTGFVRNHNNGYWTLFSNIAEEPTATTIDFNDAGLIYDTLQLGELIVSNTTPSTDVTTGALRVAGGVGIDGDLNVNSAAYIGYQASTTALTNPSIIATQSSDAVDAGQYYVQSALINFNGTGSADIVAYPNNIDDGSTGFMDMGFTGNLFSDPVYTITKANDGYLFASALEGSGLGGNLVLATDRTGTHNEIVIATGSFYANAEVARFVGNTSNGGYLALKQGTTATSTTTGALQVTGGVGVSGNVYANTFYTTTGLRWAGNNVPFSSGGGASFTSSSTPPTSPSAGDQWYNTTNDVLYEFQDVGTGTFWIDVSSPQVVSGNVTTPGSDGLSPFLLMGA